MPKKGVPKSKDRHRRLHGIGEWYGEVFETMSQKRRLELTRLALGTVAQNPDCPFAGGRCTKRGGVCSLRSYEQDTAGNVSAVGELCTTCPKRFLESSTVFQWIGEVVLDCGDPIVLSQIDFLESADEDSDASVGRIDNVLVVPDSNPMAWCPVEIQAVYFSGEKMGTEFEAIAKHSGALIPFPLKNRRPDYRSSGPKRLMPQLQVKVPSLRRWGKKMVVVIDEQFFNSLGKMDTVDHISNSDIAWFVVRYLFEGKRARLVPAYTRFTTLERSIEGLVAGLPVSLPVFEQRLWEKIRR